MEHYGLTNSRFVELVRFSNMDAQREIETKNLESYQTKILRRKNVGRKLSKFIAKHEKRDRKISNPILGGEPQVEQCVSVTNSHAQQLLLFQIFL